MPLPAILLPFAQIFGGAAMAAPGATIILTATIVKATELGLLYLGKKITTEACDEFTEKLDRDCQNYELSDVYCVANKINQFTTCNGAIIATGALVVKTAYEGAIMVYSAIGTIFGKKAEK